MCVTGREKRSSAVVALPFSSQSASSSRRVTTMSSSAGNVRSASSIALTGSESPTWALTSSVGAAAASSSARSAASTRAASSSFVNQSSREIRDAGATISVSASSPAWARTAARRSGAGTEAVATTSRRGGMASAYPARRERRASVQRRSFTRRCPARRRDVAIASVDETEEPVSDEPSSGQTEHARAPGTSAPSALRPSSTSPSFSGRQPSGGSASGVARHGPRAHRRRRARCVALRFSVNRTAIQGRSKVELSCKSLPTPLAQWREQRFSKPGAQVRFLPGAHSNCLQNGTGPPYSYRLLETCRPVRGPSVVGRDDGGLLIPVVEFERREAVDDEIGDEKKGDQRHECLRHPHGYRRELLVHDLGDADRMQQRVPAVQADESTDIDAEAGQAECHDHAQPGDH